MSNLETAIGDRKAVLISGGGLGLGGVQTHLQLLCQVLRQAGVEVTLAATGSDWSTAQLAATHSLGVRLLLPPPALLQSRRCSTLYSLITLPFQVRTQFTTLYCIGTGKSHSFLRRLVAPQTVGIYHEIVSPPNAQSLAAQNASQMQTIIANSEKVGGVLAELCPTHPVRVIPFLTADAPAPVPCPRPAVGARELRVVYLGRLAAQKRPDQLVKAWKQLSALPPLSPARLDVFGFDSHTGMLSELRHFVKTHNLEHTIQLHGAYSLGQLPQILAQADVVVLPSLWEGLPLVLVEAMQRGIPIVATAAGGTEELGRDNPDVEITALEWEAFVQGLLTMGEKLRSGRINSTRLHAWTESRYGYTTVSQKWLHALLHPQEFFGMTPSHP
ncbi:MAG: glycosyltransferase family 4 protein [Kovacikia sp.]